MRSRRDFVDEMNLLVCPVIAGQGTRLFPDTGPDMALDLVDSRTFPTGATLQSYRPTGRSRGHLLDPSPVNLSQVASAVAATSWPASPISHR